MRYVVVLLLFVTVSGCAGFLGDVVADLSTGEKTARINKDPNCRIYWPIGAGSIIVDAGPVMFVQRCPGAQSAANPFEGWVGDVFGEPGRVAEEVFAEPSRDDDDLFYTFNFSAEPGHIYEVDGATLVDITADGQVVVRSPAMSGRVEDRSTGDAAYVCETTSSRNSNNDPWLSRCVGELKTAVIRPGGTTSYQDTCWPSAGSIQGRVVFLVVDAGPIRMYATCDKILPSSEWTRKTSSFDFDAETGHIYTLSGEDEECMRLIDITSGETIIACKPYHNAPIT